MAFEKKNDKRKFLISDKHKFCFIHGHKFLILLSKKKRRNV
jgi:hypothetical protein